MTDLTPDALEAWRWAEAERIVGPLLAGLDVRSWTVRVDAEFGRLVRENVLPPAEPIGNDLPKWAQDEAERLARAEPAPKWGVHDSPRSHYALARLIAKQGKPEAAEPDQDTLDTHNLIVAWTDGSNDFSFDEVKAVLTEIKARVRREAIMALPDEPTDELVSKFTYLGLVFAANAERHMREALRAIKSVYGK